MTATLDELRDAYRIGVERWVAGRARGGSHRFGWVPKDDTEARHINGMGSVAELMVARAIDRPWLSTGTVPDAPDAGDVDGGISVRWTPRDRGSLIIHEDEPDHLFCVLVVGEKPPAMEIVGWIRAEHAKQNEGWWRTDVRHPAFFVPQWALRPIDLLRHATPRVESGADITYKDINW